MILMPWRSAASKPFACSNEARINLLLPARSRWFGKPWPAGCSSIVPQGKSGLRKAGRAGRKPGLSEKDRQCLHTLLLQGPERLGYETPLWTCPRVAHLIEQEFGVRYHEGHVWKILVSLHWSPQRPTGRARERNEEQIQHWKKKVWPVLKKKRSAKGASSSSSTKAG